MKKTKIIYWTTTILFSVFMAYSAVPDFILQHDAVVFMNHLGYPNYFIFFIGMAKLLGCIAILIPNLRIIKEWAYAGLFFDLGGALFSIIAVEGFKVEFLFFILPFSLGIASYIYNRKYQSHKNN